MNCFSSGDLKEWYRLQTVGRIQTNVFVFWLKQVTRTMVQKILRFEMFHESCNWFIFQIDGQTTLINRGKPNLVLKEKGSV